MSASILLVEDDVPVRFGIREYMTGHGFELREAASCNEATVAFRDHRPDAAVIDHRLPDGDGVDLIARLRAVDATVPLIVLTGHGTIDLAVRAMRAGAANFLTKPVELPALETAVNRAIEQRRQASAKPREKSARDAARGAPFGGRSRAIRELEEQAHRVAKSTSPKLIVGETGVGKGVLARWLHANSARASGELVDLNCASLTRELLESELFGHERGSFTGAAAAKPGLLEAASGGTLFLDELGEMDTSLQPKILKAIEEGRVRRLGAVKDRDVDLHLIAATHRDLVSRVRSGEFRGDLYFRIATIPLRVPSLRERREDIPLLAESFLAEAAAREDRHNLHLVPEAISALCEYDWPGNIRELRNVLQCAVLLCEGQEITRQHLRFAFQAKAERVKPEPEPEPEAMAGPLSLVDAERLHIERVLRRCGRVEDAARALGIPRSTLYFKLRKYGIAPSKI